MVFGNGLLHLTTTTPSTLTSLDPRSAAVLAVSPIAGQAAGLDLADGTLYVGVAAPAGPAATQSLGSVQPIDERTRAVGAPISVDRAGLVGFGSGSYWAAYPFADEIRRFSLADGRQIGEPIAGVGKGVEWMQVIGGQLWVLDAGDRTVTRYAIEE